MERLQDPQSFLRKLFPCEAVHSEAARPAAAGQPAMQQLPKYFEWNYERVVVCRDMR